MEQTEHSEDFAELQQHQNNLQLIRETLQTQNEQQSPRKTGKQKRHKSKGNTLYNEATVSPPSNDTTIDHSTGTTKPEISPDNTNDGETTPKTNSLALAAMKIKKSHLPNNKKKHQRSTSTNTRKEAQTDIPANLNKAQNTEKINELYKNNKVQITRGGKGLLDIFTITTASGESYLIASDTGCTSPLVTVNVSMRWRVLQLPYHAKSKL